MKITYITHACLLIEINKVKILTDPWLVGPSWAGCLWHYPTHNFEPKDLPTPDIIFFSHGHEDHFHNPTIDKFPKKWFNSQIIVPNFEEEWWKVPLEKKFKKIKYFEHSEKVKIKNIEFQIFKNDKGDYDSSLKIIGNKKSIFLQTDNLMSFKEANRIKSLGKIDLAFVMPYRTGTFPGFFKMKTKDLFKSADKKHNSSLKYSCEIVRRLSPKFVVPYACDLGYLGDLFHINSLHNNNKTEFSNLIKRKIKKTKPIILKSGDYFHFMKSKIKTKLTPYEYNFKSLIEFKENKKLEHENYDHKDKNYYNHNYSKIVKKFTNYISRVIKKAPRLNFSTVFIIEDTFGIKNKSVIINLRNRKVSKINFSNKKISNLKIYIKSHKINNLFNKKYDMNFLSLYNGGYVLERQSINQSINDKKFWEWLWSLDFKSK